ncbi:MAG: hypothetical protein NTZ05_03900, partial [Chloroflexi bacterium]|nr:hypothetical protein [Chloroflexota bacterium]
PSEGFADRALALPEGCGPGAELTLDTPPWSPADSGDADRRRLGVQVARIRLTPQGETARLP